MTIFACGLVQRAGESGEKIKPPARVNQTNTGFPAAAGHYLPPPPTSFELRCNRVLKANLHAKASFLLIEMEEQIEQRREDGWWGMLEKVEGPDLKGKVLPGRGSG